MWKEGDGGRGTTHRETMTEGASQLIARDLESRWPDLLKGVDEGKHAALEEARRRLIELMARCEPDATAPAQLERETLKEAARGGAEESPTQHPVALNLVFYDLAKDGAGRALSLASGVCKEWRREGTAPDLWSVACRTAHQAVLWKPPPAHPEWDWRYKAPEREVVPRVRLDAREHNATSGMNAAAFLTPDATAAVSKQSQVLRLPPPSR